MISLLAAVAMFCPEGFVVTYIEGCYGSDTLAGAIIRIPGAGTKAICQPPHEQVLSWPVCTKPQEPPHD